MSSKRSFHTEKSVAWALSNENKSLSPFSGLLLRAYRWGFLRKKVIQLCKKLEGGECFSATLRLIFEQFHGVRIGRYSYGCFDPNLFPPGAVVGNYCSIAGQLCVLRRNHPYRRVSQHPFFFNRNLGLVNVDTIEQHHDNPLLIGNDVWIGRRVTILPGCGQIGDGAIIGAGAVVTRNVEPFTVIAGNPARKITDRFNEGVKNRLQRAKWWQLPIARLIESNFPFDRDIEGVSFSEFDTISSETETYLELLEKHAANG